MALPHVQLMGRRDCCLCDQAKEVMAKVQAEGLCKWEAVDVDADKGLLVRYGMDVPVVLIDGKVTFRHGIDADQLRRALSPDLERAAC